MRMEGSRWKEGVCDGSEDEGSCRSELFGRNWSRGRSMSDFEEGEQLCELGEDVDRGHDVPVAGLSEYCGAC